MYPLYKDIRAKLGTPMWIDGEGVPRYAEFEPHLCGIYDDWAALFWVKCQACGKQILCGQGIYSTGADYVRWFNDGRFDLTMRNDAVYMAPYVTSWGDAPWHDFNGGYSFDSQCAGTTMCNDGVTLVQLWHKVKSKWEQVEITPEILAAIDSPESEPGEV